MTMCLDALISKRPNKKAGLGFKVFDLATEAGDGLPYGALLGDYQSTKKPRPEGQWLHELDFRDDPERELLHVAHSIDRITGEQVHNENTYPTGWHIWKTRASAEEWRGGDRHQVTRMVRYRQARATGIQNCRLCIVAKEIYILTQAEEDVEKDLDNPKA
jgi:hypothetical protein